jgi:hypothetical protein
MLKSDRDVWQLGESLNFGNGVAQDYLNGHFSFRYILGITNREGGLNWDDETQALYIGFTPDPMFIGYFQQQPMN